MCILVLKGILENLLRMGLIRLSHIFNVNFVGWMYLVYIGRLSKVRPRYLAVPEFGMGSFLG